MNAAAKAVLTELPDIVIAYGISDEYRSFPRNPVLPRPVLLTYNSFVFHKSCALFERRSRYDSSMLTCFEMEDAGFDIRAANS